MIWEQNTATIVMVTNLKERKEVKKLTLVDDGSLWDHQEKIKCFFYVFMFSPVTDLYSHALNKKTVVVVSVQVCPVLAGPGLLDLWEHPCVCGGHDGSGGLHHPQVLHPAGKILAVLLRPTRGKCSSLKLPYSEKFTTTATSWQASH